MSRTKRNSFHWKKRPENLNPEPINLKKHIRNLSFEKRQELGLVSSDICGGVRNGLLDTWETAFGLKGKRSAKKLTRRIFRRLKFKIIKEQIKS